MPREVTTEYLRRLLREADLTQREAAELIGVNPRTMRRYLSEAPDKMRQAGLILLERAAKIGQNVLLATAES